MSGDSPQVEQANPVAGDGMVTHDPEARAREQALLAEYEQRARRLISKQPGAQRILEVLGLNEERTA